MFVISQDGTMRVIYEHLTMLTVQQISNGMYAVAVQGDGAPAYVMGVYVSQKKAVRQMNAITDAVWNSDEYRLECDHQAEKELGMDTILDMEGTNGKCRADVGIEADNGKKIPFWNMPLEVVVKGIVIVITAFIVGGLFAGLM